MRRNWHGLIMGLCWTGFSGIGYLLQPDNSERWIGLLGVGMGMVFVGLVLVFVPSKRDKQRQTTPPPEDDPQGCGDEME